MNPAPQILLASASQARRQLLASSGIRARALSSGVDETILKAKLSRERGEPERLASALAEAKASAVSATHADDIVIGADQILIFADRIFDKPRSLAESRSQLLTLRGRTHRLISAVAAAEGGRIVWSHRDVARLTMRDFSDEFLADYMAAMGDVLLTTVGAYKIEGLGIQLFDRIEGDYFTILGLPLLPLLSFLRERKWLPG